MFSTANVLVEGGLLALRNIASTGADHAARIVAEGAVERIVYVLDAVCCVYACRRLIDLSRMLAGTGF